MSKCIHQCDHFKGCDGCWYITCSVFDKDKPSEECGEDCDGYQTRFRVSNIVWDTDGAHVEDVEELPTHCIVECAGEEEIADTLTDEYGWLIKSFDIEED